MMFITCHTHTQKKMEFPPQFMWVCPKIAYQKLHWFIIVFKSDHFGGLALNPHFGRVKAPSFGILDGKIQFLEMVKHGKTM
jgi:hypothetical protein